MPLYPSLAARGIGSDTLATPTPAPMLTDAPRCGRGCTTERGVGLAFLRTRSCTRPMCLTPGSIMEHTAEQLGHGSVNSWEQLEQCPNRVRTVSDPFVKLRGFDRSLQKRPDVCLRRSDRPRGPPDVSFGRFDTCLC